MLVRDSLLLVADSQFLETVSTNCRNVWRQSLLIAAMFGDSLYCWCAHLQIRIDMGIMLQ